jgi:hypothetical protein
MSNSAFRFLTGQYHKPPGQITAQVHLAPVPTAVANSALNATDLSVLPVNEWMTRPDLNLEPPEYSARFGYAAASYPTAKGYLAAHYDPYGVELSINLNDGPEGLQQGENLSGLWARSPARFFGLLDKVVSGWHVDSVGDNSTLDVLFSQFSEKTVAAILSSVDYNLRFTSPGFKERLFHTAVRSPKTMRRLCNGLGPLSSPPPAQMTLAKSTASPWMARARRIIPLLLNYWLKEGIGSNFLAKALPIPQIVGRYEKEVKVKLADLVAEKLSLASGNDERFRQAIADIKLMCDYDTKFFEDILARVPVHVWQRHQREATEVFTTIKSRDKFDTFLDITALTTMIDPKLRGSDKAKAVLGMTIAGLLNRRGELPRVTPKSTEPDLRILSRLGEKYFNGDVPAEEASARATFKDKLLSIPTRPFAVKETSDGTI